MFRYRKSESGVNSFQGAVMLALICVSSGLNITSSTVGQDKESTSNIEIILPVVFLTIVLLIILVLVVLCKINIIKTNPCRDVGKRLRRAVFRRCPCSNEEERTASSVYNNKEFDDMDCLKFGASAETEHAGNAGPGRVNMFEDSFLGLHTSVKRRYGRLPQTGNDHLHNHAFLGIRGKVKNKNAKFDSKHFATAKSGDVPISNTVKEEYNAAYIITEKLEVPEYSWTKNFQRGLAVIIGIDKFDSKTVKDLPAVIKDEVMVKQMFARLNFETVICENKGEAEIIDFLEKIANGNSIDYDCFAFYISSHGDEGLVCCKDFNNSTGTGCIEIDYIIGLFLNDTCKTFAQKPKLFFFDVCLGPNKQTGSYSTKGEIREFESEEERAAAFEHMLIYYATIPGYVSWAERDGSRFTKALTYVINNSDTRHSIFDILLLVYNKMSEENKKKNCLQTPRYANELTKTLYLKKKN